MLYKLMLERHKILDTFSCRRAILGSHSYFSTSKVALVAPQTRESNREMVELSEEKILWEGNLMPWFCFQELMGYSEEVKVIQ